LKIAMLRILHKFGDHPSDHQIYTTAIFIASNHTV